MKIMRMYNLIDLIVGIICFIAGLWVLNNTLAPIPLCFLFWLSGMNIGAFIEQLAFERGGTRSQDYWDQNKSGKERRSRDKYKLKE